MAILLEQQGQVSSQAMALNLISSYESDVESCDSDQVGSCASPSNGTDHALEDEFPKCLETEVTTKASFLFGSDEGTSSDDDQADKTKDISTATPTSGISHRLPSAGSVLKETPLSSSVFSSEREREDHAQVLTLSQHVPLTEKTGTRKRPLCRAFSRGKCRRGDRCHFEHPVVSVLPKDAAVIAGAPRMYDAHDVFAKKPKTAYI
uniref:C3H1-type domain-containing protein n=1 Tax=Angiostrongylus cantonensis TaxID=6313 RepID=A0A0K0D9A7_ANGCA